MRVTQGYVLSHAIFVDDFAFGLTFTGLLLAVACIICVGEYLSQLL